ncbi:MAG TPA: WbqC family protein [Cytophagaceae bacterium]
MQEKTLLVELHHLPSVPYFVEVVKTDRLCIEVWENYQKQTCRNRCYILTANKVQMLSVPVKNTGSKVLVRDIKIDYSQKWLPVHWRAIQSAYGKAPYFEYFSGYFKEILDKKHSFLFDLNIELLSLCLKLLSISREVTYTSGYGEVSGKADTTVIDQRNNILNYGENSNNLKEDSHVSYFQLFGSKFVPNLSIVDLLFNEGPEAKKILLDSVSN